MNFFKVHFISKLIFSLCFIVVNSLPLISQPSFLRSDYGIITDTRFDQFNAIPDSIVSSGSAGTNVYWDFVELPSQIFENWCYEKECLDLFATHYETGESIPVEFIEKIKESANFQSGLTTIRQLAFSFLDIAWHSQDNINISDIKSFEVNATQSCDLYPIVAEISSSCSFSHIFQGGYSSGYYSYKWAEVIEADAFEAFKEAGIFNQEVAHTFFNNILSQGGSEHPSILYRKFRGRDADPKALLRREGLLTN